MTGKNIYILSAPVHSGKTTTLLKWVLANDGIAGILSPVIDGKRVFMNAATREIFEMEAKDSGDELPVGRFVFSLKSFERAVLLLSEAAKKNKGWLVIDEIGPLELNGKGFSEVLKRILSADYNSLKILLVVRELLVDDVLRYFELPEKGVKIIGVDDKLFWPPQAPPKEGF